MKEKYTFGNDFSSYKSSYDKYYELGSYMKTDRYGNYTSALEDFLGYYKADKSAKREETEQEKEARLLREKAAKREAKIDEILKK
jgi:hypothetical protein